jgi:4-hydroxyacetophenone monooxygenase
MLEEMDLEREDTRGFQQGTGDSRPQSQGFHVLVIGAGMSGLLTAIRLEQAGIRYSVVEKNAGIGGTWFENTYPGARVDIANHFYCYSFEPNSNWSEYFAQKDELRAYFESCAGKYGVLNNISFETEVESAKWSEENARWSVRLRTLGGKEEAREFDAIVSAVGQLNRPRIPSIEGKELFSGPAFHSAEWDHDIDLRGKRVAVIGTGASALQLVPEVAKKTSQLYVFQRSPAWMFPNPDYHAKVSDGKKWLLAHVPFYARWYRFLLFWPGSDGLMPSLIVDPDWPHPERSVNAINEATRVWG